MADIPDFSIPIWGRREIQAKEIQLKYTVFVPGTPILPGASGYADVYVVPAGKRYFVSDCYGSSNFRGALYGYVPTSHDIYAAYFEPWDTHFASLALPIPVEAGQRVRIAWENNDFFGGFFRFLVGLWWEPESKWKEPKSDDPLEKFKLGDWNFARYFLEPDGSYSVIFRKAGEKKSNYLKLQNPYQPKEKKLASGKLEANEVQEIFNTLNIKPEKVKQVLEKYEKKFAETKIY